MAEIITLDIYEDEDFEVLKRTATAKNRKIGYGLIMKLVELMDFKGVEDLNNEEALPVVLSSYRSITRCSGECSRTSRTTSGTASPVRTS